MGLDNIDNEVLQAIEANLTAEVAGKLYTILDEGGVAKRELSKLRANNGTLRIELERLRELESKAALVAKQKETYEELRRELDNERRIMDEVENERDRTDGQILELARIVFGSSERGA